MFENNKLSLKGIRDFLADAENSRRSKPMSTNMHGPAGGVHRTYIPWPPDDIPVRLRGVHVKRLLPPCMPPTPYYYGKPSVTIQGTPIHVDVSEEDPCLLGIYIEEGSSFEFRPKGDCHVKWIEVMIWDPMHKHQDNNNNYYIWCKTNGIQSDSREPADDLGIEASGNKRPGNSFVSITRGKSGDYWLYEAFDLVDDESRKATYYFVNSVAHIPLLIDCNLLRDAVCDYDELNRLKCMCAFRLNYEKITMDYVDHWSTCSPVTVFYDCCDKK